jgi:uncharacterized iron-regulated membrane protein
MIPVKSFFRTIHLYLGLTAGLVIMITCFTGASLVFEKELQLFIYPERYTVKENENRFSLEQLAGVLRREVPNATISGVKIYAAPERSVEFTYSAEEIEETKPIENKNVSSESNTEKIKKVEAGKGAGNNQAFMNPYTGQLISLYSHRNSFFYAMFSLHRWLLAGDTGKLIVGISTSIFLFILLTGIILWWPKNKKKLKQRLKLKWNAGWKRINHDLHIVIGFYTAIFLFIFAFTGLAWSFQWFNNGIYWITGTENKRSEPPVSVYQKEAVSISLDAAYASIKEKAGSADYFSIAVPKDSAASFAVTVMPLKPVHEKATDQYFLDQYSGALLSTASYKDRNLGQRVRSAFYPFHVGSIGGLPGRIIAFMSCLAGVAFPITGVILWINRLKKEKRKKNNSRKISETLEDPFRKTDKANQLSVHITTTKRGRQVQ